MRASLRPLLHVAATAGAFLAAGLVPCAQADAPASYYLEAFVNGRDTQLIVQVDRDARGLVMSADELTEIGIRVDTLALDEDRRIALDDVPGLRYRYLEAEQRLELTLPDAQLVPERIGFVPPPPAPATSGTGLLFNYSAHLQSTRVSYEQKQNARRVHAPLLGSARYGRLPPLTEQHAAAQYEKRNRTFSASTELRWFSPRGVWVNTGFSTLDSGRSDYTRQDTYWTSSNVDRMRTWTVGDFVSSSLAWSRAVRLGGISLARNFDVRPDLITFPVPALGGSAVVPTTVDLYINGLRQATGQASGGPFLFASPPSLSGAGQASIVFQDALGREVVIQRPLYLDTRLLAAGNTDFALQLGYLRRDYGTRSFAYGDSPAAMGSLRHGLRDGLTLEAHAEFADGLHNVGVGGLVELGRFGVLDASLSDSGGQTRGQQYGMGYQYLSPRFSLDLRGLHTQGDFRDIGTLDGAAIPQTQAHASLSVPITPRHTAMLTYTRQQATSTGGSRVVTLGYNGAFGTRLNVFATFFRDLDHDDSDGLYVGATLSLDNRLSASASASRNGAARTATLGASRSMDYDRGGFGWSVSLDGGNAGYRHGLGRLDYRGGRIEATLQAEHARRDASRYDSHSLFATGALVLMEGDLMASRYVYDAFAVVSTNGVAGVPVLRENRFVGTTNREGHVVVPDLIAYQSNAIALDTLELPIDVGIEHDRMELTPLGKSGALARFAAQRFTGATVILVDESGMPLPVGTPIVVVGSDATGIVGYDGQVFLPELDASTQLEAVGDQARCVATIRFDPQDTLKTIGPFTCRRSP
ncbi:fimbria/pilus outer membrane usher protein [Lysobacter arvi]|uniref:Fimbria/pilus outer membrane usher protein n=1 Tax=Lysobacter arvi TaxID=3038776 RepID=A0ABU1CAY6_9GAMM|nr:fimbria/pilus outer membrane usher protein [Lysobacter arvi]MDR0182337.1 fimbria/pilus outer membrane usher protein [Lysobacter arvi]